MKVKVLQFVSACEDDHGRVMNTFVFTDDVDLAEVKRIVDRVWEESEGTKNYIDIIDELFGDKQIEVAAFGQIDW